VNAYLKQGQNMGLAWADSIRGYLCVTAAAAMWASSGTTGKALFNAGMTPFELVQIRVTLSTILMTVAFFIFSRRLLRIRLRDLGYFAALGAVCMALVQGTYFYAISRIQVAAAILLEYMAPILVAAFAMCYWKERLTLYKLTSLALSIFGCYLVVGGYNLELLSMNRVGILAGLASAVCFAGYSLLGERGMHRYSPWTVMFYAMAFASLTWHILQRPFSYLGGAFTWSQWLCILYISVVGTILPFGLYFVGVNYIRSTRASITATLEPICAALMAFLLLGETLEIWQMVGGALVIFSIVLLQLNREQNEMAPVNIRNNHSPQQRTSE
jgi:drug/metabolite transporter (DMT)-like permease